LKIETDGFHLIIKVKVNGKSATLLVDTGASQTVFDISRIKKLLKIDDENFKLDLSPHLSTGLGTNTMESHIVVIKKFQVGSLQLKNYNSVALPMEYVNQSYEMLGFKGIDGVLGSDFLLKYNAIIYYKKKLLKIYY